MPHISLRMSSQEEARLNRAAKKSGMDRSEYMRRILFESGNVAEKIDFYRTINLQNREIVKQSVFTTQLLCQVLLHQTDAETVQKIILELKKKLEEDEKNEG